MTPARATELDLLDSVLSKVVEGWAKREPDRVCIVQDDGARVTYGELDGYANAIAAGLAAHGVGAGDRVVSFMTNDLRVVYLTVALGKLGAIEVPVNPSLIGDSLRHVLSDASPRVAVVDSARRAQLQDALEPEAGVVVIESPGADGATSGDALTLDAMLTGSAAPIATTAVGSEPGAIMYTSGTTGLPKGALLSHRHTMQICQRAIIGLELTEDDTLLTILPLFHGGGKYMNVGACLLSGARCYLVRQFSASGFWKQACESEATVAHALVSIAHFLLAQPPAPEDRVHKITRALIAPTTTALAKAMNRRFGIRIFQAYASTECNIPVLNDPDGGAPAEACGRVCPPYRIRIVDQYDRELPRGEIGEIVVSCDEPWSVFSGYWNQPETTLETIRNFGVHSGDAGYLDANGYLYFVDRIKDVIRRRGENISSQTIEDAINAINGVTESAAYAVPSEFGEDEIAVAIVRTSGSDLTLSEVEAACREALPHFAVPRFVRFMDALPKTETGKIQKFKLKKQGTDGAEVIEEARRSARRS